MSPSESELRAALRRGEGDRLDPDAVLAQARAARRSRRTTVGAVVGSVVVVAGIATSAAVLAGGSSDGHGHEAAPPASATQSAPPQRTPLTQLPGQVGGTGGPVPPTCPGSTPHLATPPGNQFGADQPLLPADTTRITVCVYQQDATPAGGFTLTGPDAAALARQLDALPVPSGGSCPTDVSAAAVVLLPDRGREVVGTLNACGLLTNGTAKRQGRDALIDLIGKAVLHTIPPGRVSHGPAPS